MHDTVIGRFEQVVPRVEDWSIRVVDDWRERISVRQDLLQPITERRSTGAMITIADSTGTGYAATSDLSVSGLRSAVTQARAWAARSAALGLGSSVPITSRRGSYHTPAAVGWEAAGLDDKVAWLHSLSRALRSAEPGTSADARNRPARILDWEASLGYRQTESLLVSSRGARIEQVIRYLDPGLRVVANEGSSTQVRTHSLDRTRQGGLENIVLAELEASAARLSEEALTLLDAPACPSGNMDVLILPGQMMLQIHESIGHPLELDRILGDERNYAGTSFVTLDMFGRFRYGSELLTVTFDPSADGALASYAFDDEGTPAEPQLIIRDGILVRPLGGALSQLRAGLDGVANARASSWNRAPIDRMANLDMLPGNESFDDLVAGIEHGVLLDTNRSWSIDDSRNKFQFGCELGRVIRDGALAEIVKNPSYRGISATFWRSLSHLGDASTLERHGTPTCGKGEPNQLIAVGHAAPACVFSNVSVFGTA